MTATMTLQVDLDCDERCFELPHWRELLARDPNTHIFATPEWNRIWWDEFGANIAAILRQNEQGAGIGSTKSTASSAASTTGTILMAVAS